MCGYPQASSSTSDPEVPFNNSGEEFGEWRLIEALQLYRGESSQALISSLLDEFGRSTLTNSRTISPSSLPTVEKTFKLDN
jgi:hypothetical protein